jgi:hypothetical protein
MWLVVTLACAPVGPEEARQARLVDTLLEDNRVWLSRDPELLAAKYAKMAGDPYDFLRGTAAFFHREAGRVGAERARVPGFSDLALHQLLIAGDPHPENFGLYLVGAPPAPVEGPAAPVLVVELNDFDAAGFGHPWLDLRRLVLGLLVAAEPWEGCLADCRAGASRAAWEGYLRGVARGAPVLPAGRGPFLAELEEVAREEGAVDDRLVGETDLEGGERVLERDLALDDAGEGRFSLTAEEQETVDRLIAAYRDHPSAPEGFRAVDAVRRFGGGVASLPAERFTVLFDQGDLRPGSEGLLQIREVVDPPSLPGLPDRRPALLGPGAERAVQAAQWLWGRPDRDPRLAALLDGARTFKVLSWSSYQAGLDHGDLAEVWADGASAEDLAALAAALGEVLGASHARAPLGDGLPAGARLRAALAAAPRDAADQVAATGEADLGRLLQDYRLFLDALERLGPLLGADRLGEEDR